MFSSYSLSAAFDASEAVCEMPAFASAAAEPPLEELVLSIAEDTLLVIDSGLMEVSLFEGLSLLVSDGRGIVYITSVRDSCIKGSAVVRLEVVQWLLQSVEAYSTSEFFPSELGEARVVTMAPAG